MIETHTLSPSADIAPPTPDKTAGAPRRWLWLGALLVAGPPLLVYALTLEPSLYFADSGLILATIKDFGIAYSPGFPLYIIVAKLWTLLAGALHLGSFTQQANYVAALAAAGMAVVVYLCVFQLLAVGVFRRVSGVMAPKRGNGRRGRAGGAPRAGTAATAEPGHRRPGRGVEATGVPERPIVFVAAVMAGWLAAFSYTVWSQAINADMYTLQGLFAALTLYLAIRLWQSSAVTEAPSRTRRRLLVGLLAAYGCAWAVHYLSVGIVPFMLAVLWSQRRVLRDRVAFVAAGAFLLCAALPYAYEPLRSAMWPQVDWAHVADPGNLLGALSGATWTAQSSSYRVFQSGQLYAALSHWLYVTVVQFFPLALPFVLAGWYVLWHRYRPLFVPFVLFYLGAVAVGVVYISNNAESYLIPAHMLLALLAGLGLAEAARALPAFIVPRLQALLPAMRRRSQAMSAGRHSPAFIAALAGLLLAGATLVLNYPHLDRHSNYVEQEYGQNAFMAVPRDGIMLVPGDSLNAAALYLQIVAGYRRDVAVLPETLVQTRWWRASFRRHHPGVVLPEVPLAGVASEQQWMSALIAALLHDNPGRTLYLLTLAGKAIPPGYVVVPAGIGYRVVALSDRAGLAVRRADWNFSLLSLRQALRAPRDVQQAYNVFAREIQLAYVQAFQNLGDVDINAGHYRLAVRDNTTALEFYPTDPQLRLSLGAGLALAGQTRRALGYLPAAVRHSVPAAHTSARVVQAAFAPLINSIGLSYYNAGDYYHALQGFMTASLLAPTYPDALLDQGAVLYQQGRYQEALAVLLRGVRVAPRNATMYYNLAQVYTRLNQPRLARRMLQKALALDPGLAGR